MSEEIDMFGNGADSDDDAPLEINDDDYEVSVPNSDIINSLAFGRNLAQFICKSSFNWAIY